MPKPSRPIEEVRELTIVSAASTTAGLLTTVALQPLEVLRTRLQLIESRDKLLCNKNRIFGSATMSALRIVRERNITYLWRGTGATLARQVPGVCIYFVTLHALSKNFSKRQDRPDSPAQAFCFAIFARSLVSIIFLPVSVIKVRYESGQYYYKNLPGALWTAYKGIGWIGAVPTVMKDALFSGVYYMCYNHFKDERELHLGNSASTERRSIPIEDFTNGLISGIVASILTNPLEVIRVNIQAGKSGQRSMFGVARMLRHRGYARFFDGMLIRTVKRSIVPATTWTIFEFLKGIMS